MKPNKNRSARDKQRARERARREARQRQGSYPLQYLQPPFEPYKEWIRVPEQAKDMIEYPIRSDDLPSDAVDFMDTLIKLGPRYHGIVPLAAVYLDDQISRGSVVIAVTGQPGQCREMPLAELAASVSSPEVLEEMRRDHPDAGLPEEASLTTDDAAAMHLHELHTRGYLIMDDDHVINMAIPPKTPGGKWLLNGHDDSDAE